jgi:hypothetical protein
MLRNSLLLVATLVFGLALVTGGALADSCQGQAKKAGHACAHPGAAMCCHKYDAEKVTMISGEIVEIERTTCETGKTKGIHLTLKTDEEKVEVHLGPAWFLDAQEGEFAAGDMIEVKGCKITAEGKSAFIAAKIAKGDAVLVLRDDEGWPVWSAWRQKAS